MLPPWKRSWGFPLVTHDGKPVLTSVGLVFVSNAAAVVERYEEMLAVCRKAYRRALDAVRIPNYRRVLKVFDEFVGPFESDLVLPMKGLRFEYVPLADVESMTEFEALDSKKLDIAFTFSPHDSFRHLADLAVDVEDYRFVPMGTEGNMVQVACDHPLAKRDSVSADVLSRYKILCTKAPFYRTATYAQIARAEEAGQPVEVTNGPQGVQYQLVQLDHRYISLQFAHSVEVGTQAKAGSAYLYVDGADLSVWVCAVCRKDNPNPNVHQLMDWWQQLGSRHRCRPVNGSQRFRGGAFILPGGLWYIVSLYLCAPAT